METPAMGKVLVKARIENVADLFEVSRGHRKPEDVRSVDVPDALIGSGASGLLLPKRLIAQLGLEQFRIRSSRSIHGRSEIPMYRAVRLMIQDRDCVTDVGEIGDEFPVIVGQLPLEVMDWVIDMKGQKLIGNPEHNGEWMMDVFVDL